MFKQMCHWWFKTNGWQAVNAIPEKSDPDEIRKYVIVAAPHTSNWDFFLGMGALDVMKLPARFTIKKEWMFFPVGTFLRYLGAIFIDRSATRGMHHSSMVDVMVDILNTTTEDLAIVITPEATRSKRDKWRTGFYHVAKKAHVPILLGFIDYKNRECGVKEIVMPSDDMEADMRKIMAFYQSVNPRHVELFSIDKRYIKPQK
jgi:1-acyl-sn-glycerol-3-phosphate acyltransferase